MTEQESRDETNRLLGRVIADNEQAIRHRTELRASMESMRSEFRPLLDLPMRMTNLETQTANNHSANVASIKLIEADLDGLKTWRDTQEGLRAGMRMIGHFIVAFIGAVVGFIGAVIAILKLKWIS